MKTNKTKQTYMLLLLLAAGQTFAFEPNEEIVSDSEEKGLIVDTTEEDGKSTGRWKKKIQDLINKGVEWTRDKTYETAHDQVEDQNKVVGKTLFEKITQIKTEDFSYKIMTASVHANRRVIPNSDVADTYTVVDHFKIPFGLRLHSFSTPFKELAGVNLGMNLSSKGYLETWNVRQVVPEAEGDVINWDNWKKIKDEVTTFKFDTLKSSLLGNVTHVNDSVQTIKSSLAKNKSAGIEEIEESQDKDYFVNTFLKDDENRARYSKVLRIVAHPLFMPVGEKSLNNYHVGEIFSFKSFGHLQLTGTIGWKYSVDGISSPLSGSFSATTFINGHYQFSMMKTDKTKMKVKITRIRAAGINKQFIPISVTHKFFDGLAVLGHDLAQKVSISPIKINTNKKAQRNFSIVFEYDVSKKKARNAMRWAIAGDLRKSQALAKEEESGVKKETQIKTLLLEKGNSINISIPKVYSWSFSNKKQDYTTQIVTMDGTKETLHNIDKTYFLKNRQWSSIFKASEKEAKSMKLEVDREEFEKGNIKSMSLRIDHNIDDSSTKKLELRSYLKKISNLIGIEDYKDIFFHLTPVKVKDDFNPSDIFESYESSKTTIRATVQLDLEDIRKFTHAGVAKMAAIVSEEYDLRENILDVLQRNDGNVSQEEADEIRSALTFLQKWIKIRREKDAKNYHDKLAAFIKSYKFNKRLYSIMNRVIDLDSAGVKITFSNESIGSYKFTNGGFHTIDKYTGRANAIGSFDNTRARKHYDTGARVTGIKAEVKNNDIQITASFNHVPKYLYLLVENTTFGHRGKYKKIIVEADGIVKKGKNTITISKDHSNDKVASLRSMFKQHRHYKIRIAFSRDGHSFGKVETKKFVYMRDLKKEKKKKKK